MLLSFLVIYIAIGLGFAIGAMVGDQFSNLDIFAWNKLDWSMFGLGIIAWPIFIWLKLRGEI